MWEDFNLTGKNPLARVQVILARWFETFDVNIILILPILVLAQPLILFGLQLLPKFDNFDLTSVWQISDLVEEFSDELVFIEDSFFFFFSQLKSDLIVADKLRLENASLILNLQSYSTAVKIESVPFQERINEA